MDMNITHYDNQCAEKKILQIRRPKVQIQRILKKIIELNYFKTSLIITMVYKHMLFPCPGIFMSNIRTVACCQWWHTLRTHRIGCMVPTNDDVYCAHTVLVACMVPVNNAIHCAHTVLVAYFRLRMTYIAHTLCWSHVWFLPRMTCITHTLYWPHTWFLPIMTYIAHTLYWSHAWFLPMITYIAHTLCWSHGSYQ